MSVPFLLTAAQMRRIQPHFPLSHGMPRVDDRRVLSGIIFVIKAGLRWRDAPPAYGPHKTLYNRFIRWTRMCVFSRIFHVPIRRVPPTAVRLTLFCVRTGALVSVGKDGGVDGDHHRGRA